jgi:hypothetical protein
MDNVGFLKLFPIDVRAEHYGQRGINTKTVQPFIEYNLYWMITILARRLDVYDEQLFL